MLRFRLPHYSILFVGLLLQGTLNAQGGIQEMPREDVIDVPFFSIGEGLCVSNVFQSNMVLQRDRPMSIWGWADAGEVVTVSIGGNEQASTAAQNRSWKITFRR